MTQWLHKGKREYPERLAAVCEGRRVTYGELYDRVVRLAGVLVDHGVKAGDRVAVLGLNTDYYLEAYYALWWLGVIVNPVNHRWTNDEIVYSFEDSGTKLLLVDDAFAPKVEALRAAAPQLEKVLLLSKLPETKTAPEDVRAGGDTPAALFYTGGTTGKSKGVLLGHAGMYAATIASMLVSERAPATPWLNGLPMFHMGGLAVVLHAMAAGSTQVMLPLFAPGAFLETLEKEQIVEASMVPTMIRACMDHEDLKKRDLTKLKRLYYGASPIDETLIDKVLTTLPWLGMFQYYGMTETSAIATTLPPWCHGEEGRKKGYHLGAGFPTASAELAILGPDDREVPRGQSGEICVRGPGVMLGYWQLPDISKTALRGGWMHTGDVGYLNEQGLLFVVDRIKDMIITGGENVYSVEVEGAILSLPGVAQCAVVGMPDKHWGERVHAVVVRHPNAKIDETAVIEHCRKQIAGYKCPRSVEFRDSLPLSGAGKILKYKLREALT